MQSRDVIIFEMERTRSAIEQLIFFYYYYHHHHNHHHYCY